MLVVIGGAAAVCSAALAIAKLKIPYVGRACDIGFWFFCVGSYLDVTQDQPCRCDALDGKLAGSVGEQAWRHVSRVESSLIILLSLSLVGTTLTEVCNLVCMR